MQTVSEVLHSLTAGTETQLGNLAVTPLFGQQIKHPSYLTLDEALSDSSVHITEVSETGSVPDLLVVNRGALGVLIVDGDEFVGAKQNRVANLSILVPANTTLVIPVSCVESGRWHHTSRTFRSEKRSYYAEGRARKAAHVTEALASRGTRHSRQGEVWADIAAKADRLAAHSATAAMSSMYDSHERPLAAFEARFPPHEGQVGAVYRVPGRLVGLETFDSATTYAKVAAKIVRSYALDAIDDAPSHVVPERFDVAAFIAAIANAELRSFPAIGEGEDFRLTDPSFTGGGLMARDRLIHISAFAALERRENVRTY